MYSHITFATGQFLQSALALSKSARRYGLRSTIFTPKTPLIRDLRVRRPAIMSAPRGAGFWLWKPCIIADALGRAADGDMVLYTDSAVEIVADPRPLFELADVHDVLLFHQEAPAARWTKRDAFVLMDADAQRYWETPILNAAFAVFKAGPRARAFANDYLAYCEDARILTDTPNTCGFPNLPIFEDHRHDQSVLTILAKREGIPTFLDPSQFGQRPPDYPFGQVFDHHRRRSKPFLYGIRSKLQLGTRIKRLVGGRR